MPKKKAIEAVICPSKSDSVIISLGIIVSAKVSNQIYRHKQPKVDIVENRLSIERIAPGTYAASVMPGIAPGIPGVSEVLQGVTEVLAGWFCGLEGRCSKSFGETPSNRSA